MPTSLSIAAFVLGAILLLIALVGGGFKLFGSEIPRGVSATNRKISMVLGCVFVIGALFSDRLPPTPPPDPDVVSSPKTQVADVYVHPSGSFERQGEIWVEYPPYAPGQNFHFKEARRDDQFVYLYDETRHKENDPVRVYYLRLPISGGMAEWSYPNPFQWQPLYPVTRKAK